MEETKKQSNPRMHNPDGIHSGIARKEDYFSLRDHFAGLAMQGLMTATDSEGTWTTEGCENDVALISYKIADKMLKQREL